MPTLMIILQYGTGVLLAVSAMLKLPRRSRQSLTVTVGQVLNSNEAVHTWVTGVIITCEACLSICLFLGVPDVHLIGTVAAVVFAVFSIAIARPVARGARVRCACFGATSKEVNTTTFVRNGILISAASLLATSATGPSYMLGALLPGAMTALLGHALIVSSDTTKQLKDEMPPPMAPPPLGAHLGDLIPASMSSTTGKVVLAFLSPGCGGCVRSAQPLADAALELGAHPIALIDRFGASTEAIEELEGLLEGAGVSLGSDDLWQQIRSRTSITGFPSFVALDASGSISVSALGLQQLPTLTSQARES